MQRTRTIPVHGKLGAELKCEFSKPVHARENGRTIQGNTQQQRGKRTKDENGTLLCTCPEIADHHTAKMF
eukprot:scaffold287_cov337-Pavlova_lutheri.AAC.13